MAQKRTRTPPTPGQLGAMLQKHLSFEINRFRLAASFWGKRRHDRLVDAMIRESCLIHLRLLLDFFYPRYDPESSRYEDVFVSDYLPERDQMPPELHRLLEKPPWLEDYRNQLDWRVAHLTLKRIGFERQPAWEPLEQFAHMEKLISLFLTALPPEMARLFDPGRQG